MRTKLFSEREKDILRDLIDQQLLLEKGKDLGFHRRHRAD